MKSFQLTDEEKMTLLEKVKGFPRPAKFAKTEVAEEIVEQVVEETIEEAVPEQSDAVKKTKRRKNINQD